MFEWSRILKKAMAKWEVKCIAKLRRNCFSVNVSALALVFRRQISKKLQFQVNHTIKCQKAYRFLAIFKTRNRRMWKRIRKMRRTRQIQRIQRIWRIRLTRRILRIWRIQRIRR